MARKRGVATHRVENRTQTWRKGVLETSVPPRFLEWVFMDVAGSVGLYEFTASRPLSVTASHHSVYISHSLSATFGISRTPAHPQSPVER
jgi:hypothetical protein